MTGEIKRRRKLPVGKILLVLFLAFLTLEVIMLPFPWTVAKLRTENPRLTSLMKERIAEAKGNQRRYVVHRAYVPLSRISEDMVHAVIVGEDGTFYENNGVDWYEVQQSFKTDLDAMKIIRGSSTITMQLAKNLWFSTSRDPLTKLNEVLSAYMLDHYLPKSRVMELYLNYIEFGRGIFGVEAASELYYGKPASALTRDQASRLAAIIPSPLRHAPNSDSRFVSFRTSVILERMQARGW